MPQVLKEEVREQILSAALRIFSQYGFLKTRMSDIARETGVSTSNLYRYYASKDEIFDAIFPNDFPKEFLKVFRNRVNDLNRHNDWIKASGTSDNSASTLLEFLIKNRELSLILLQGSEGTRYSKVKDELISELTTSAITYFKAKTRKTTTTHLDQFIIKEVFRNTISVMTNVLQHHTDPAHIRGSFNFYWQYHLSGLQTILNSQ